MPRGKFIVIEGPDGSGKSEQFNRLVLRLPEGTELRTVHFPRYEEPSSYFVREYLAGNYGSLAEIGPYKASLFYALDRYDAGAKEFEKWLQDGKTIIVDRYVGSNMGHQGAKMDSKAERIEYYKWLHETEFHILGIPKPDLNIILHIPSAIAFELRKKRAESGNGPVKKDIHEEDLVYMQKSERVYLELAELFPKDFTIVECAPNGKLMTIEEVHEKVWEIARKVLEL